MAHKVAPGLLRTQWAHTGWHDYDRRSWSQVVDEANAQCQREWDGVIAGCDIHEARFVSSFTPFMLPQQHHLGQTESLMPS